MSQHTLSQSLALERGGAWSAVNILWSALNPQVPYWTESVRIAPSAEQRLSGLCETKWRSCCMKNWCKIWAMLMKHYETWFMSPFCNVQVHASRDTTAPPSGGENVFWDKQMISKRSKKMCPPILYLVLGRSLVASLHGSMEVWNCLNSKCEQIHFGMNNSCPISKVKWSKVLGNLGIVLQPLAHNSVVRMSGKMRIDMRQSMTWQEKSYQSQLLYSTWLFPYFP